MEPFEKDELSDRELDDLLRKWESPAAPARLRAAIFPETPEPWWRRLWRSSIRIPAPVALAIALVVGLAIWRRPAPAPVVATKTVRVEVPVIQERVATRIVYRDRTPSQTMDVHRLRPVAELRPVIIRRENVQN
jgi:hypothetical protein